MARTPTTTTTSNFNNADITGASTPFTPLLQRDTGTPPHPVTKHSSRVSLLKKREKSMDGTSTSTHQGFNETLSQDDTNCNLNRVSIPNWGHPDMLSDLIC